MARLFLVCLALTLAAAAYGEDEPAPPTAPAPQLPFDPCPMCLTATAIFDRQLAVMGNMTQTIGTTLAQACDTAGPAKGACLLFVRQYGGLFAYGLSIAKYSLDGFCPAMFFCPPPSFQMMTQNGIFDTVCNVCMQTMQGLLATLTSEQVTKQAQMTIHQICSAPMVDEEECTAAFGKALMQSMATTAQVLEPKSFCTLLGPCALGQSAPPSEPAVPPAPATEEVAAEKTRRLPVT